MRVVIYKTQHMFLFNKKTRNIIKYAWAVFAILIIFSMVIAYSGFTSLTSAPQPTPVEAPSESASVTIEPQSTETVAGDEMEAETNPEQPVDLVPVETPEEPPVPQLDFSI